MCITLQKKSDQNINNHIFINKMNDSDILLSLVCGPLTLLKVNYTKLNLTF
jgi:hypothetical protein